MLVDEEENNSIWSTQKSPANCLSTGLHTDTKGRELPSYLTLDEESSYVTSADRERTLISREETFRKENKTADHHWITELQNHHNGDLPRRDSNELVLSPQCSTRDSLVDHMLLSFDQAQQDYHLHSSNFENLPSYSGHISNHEMPLVPAVHEHVILDVGNKVTAWTSGIGTGSEPCSTDTQDRYGYNHIFATAVHFPRMRNYNSNYRMKVGTDHAPYQRKESQAGYQGPTSSCEVLERVNSQMSNVVGAKGSSVDLSYSQPPSSQRWRSGQLARSSSFDLGSEYHLSNSKQKIWNHIREPSSSQNSVILSPSQSLRRKTSCTSGKVPLLDPLTPLTPFGTAFFPSEDARNTKSSGKFHPRSTRSSESRNIRTSTPIANEFENLPQNGRECLNIQSRGSSQNSALSKKKRMTQFKEEKGSISFLPMQMSSVPDSMSPNQVKEKPGFFRRVFCSKTSTGNNYSILSTNNNHNNHDQNFEQSPPHGSSTLLEATDRPKYKPRLIDSQIKNRSSPESIPPSSASLNLASVYSPPPVSTLPLSLPSHNTHSMESMHHLNKKPSSLFRRRKKLSSKCPQNMPSIDSRSSHQYENLEKLLPNPPNPSVIHTYYPTPRSAYEQRSQSEFDYENRGNNVPNFDSPNSINFLSAYDIPPNINTRAIRNFGTDSVYGISSPDISTPKYPKNHQRSRSQSVSYDGFKSDCLDTFFHGHSDNERDVIHSRSSFIKSHTAHPLNNNAPASIKEDYTSESITRPKYSSDGRTQTLWDQPSLLVPRQYINEHTIAIRKAHIARKQSEDWVKITETKSPSIDKDDRLWLEPSSDEESSVSRLGTDETIFFDSKCSPNKSTTSLHDSLPNSIKVKPWESYDFENRTIHGISSSLPEQPKDNTNVKYGSDELEVCRQIYDGCSEFVPKHKAAAWLGEEDGGSRTRILQAYMKLFNFTNLNILAALRLLCSRLILKAESQQVDRIIDAFSKRWVECNPSHAFKFIDVVHTICYSLLLLNTDLHLAEIEQKMTRSQFIKNTMPTIRKIISESSPDAFESKKHDAKPVRRSLEIEKPNWNSSMKPPMRGNGTTTLPPTPLDFETPVDDSGPLVRNPFRGTIHTWEVQVEIILKSFYISIRNEPLPLYGSTAENSPVPTMQTNLSENSGGGLRRTPSALSHTPSDSQSYRSRKIDTLRINNGMRPGKNRSRPRLYPPPSGFGSSRTSFDEQSPMWSSVSSSWSKYSLGKTPTTISLDSWGSTWPSGDGPQSIGFANALSQAIIREENVASSNSTNEDLKETAMAPRLEDESLELYGAPWAKEGMVKHKHHLESVEKKARERNWTEVFAVIEKGYLSLFSFSAKSLRHKTKGAGKSPNNTVGGGNWQENAQSLGSFLLQQTIASALPSPGYSSSRPYVWALSLPTGAVHFFQVGTPDIVREFVSTANYWSARLSNHPLIGGISNVEYGWSDSILNGVVENETVLSSAEISKRPATSSRRRTSMSGRSSAPGSARVSLDQSSATSRPRIIADKISISDWTTPTQNMRASTLSEKDHLNSLINYVCGIEEELQKHNQLRPLMRLTFPHRHPNAIKAMANWEKKSSYLLREIVKFKTYIDILQAAEATRQRIYSEQRAAVGEDQGSVKERKEICPGE